MAVARTWQHPHHRVAGVCLLRISCAFPVFEPAHLGATEVASTVRQLLLCRAWQLYHIRTHIFELFYAEWKRVPWVSEEMDHACNLLVAILALKEAYPSIRLQDARHLIRSDLRRLKTRAPTDFWGPPLDSSDSDGPPPLRTITCGAVTWQRFLPHHHVQEDE